MIDSIRLAKETSEANFIARLASDVVLRTAHSGENVAILRCIGEDGRAFTTGYWLRPLTLEKRHLLTMYLVTGTCVRLVGCWQQHNWEDRHGIAHAWEFQARYIETVLPPGL